MALTLKKKPYMYERTKTVLFPQRPQTKNGQTFPKMILPYKGRKWIAQILLLRDKKDIESQMKKNNRIMRKSMHFSIT